MQTKNNWEEEFDRKFSPYQKGFKGDVLLHEREYVYVKQFISTLLAQQRKEVLETVGRDICKLVDEETIGDEICINDILNYLKRITGKEPEELLNLKN